MQRFIILTIVSILFCAGCSHLNKKPANIGNGGGWNTHANQNGIGVYSKPNIGTLYFSIPTSWVSNHKINKSNNIETIVFNPMSGNSFRVMVDPLMSIYDDDTIKSMVEKRGNKFLAHAKETNLKIYKAKGVDSTGYYYTLEDKYPKPGGWQFMTQGKINIGGYCLNFTILTHSFNAIEKENALKMLTTSKFKQI